MEGHPFVDLWDQTKASHAMKTDEGIVLSFFRRYLPAWSKWED
jgi:hypothetical protein